MQQAIRAQGSGGHDNDNAPPPAYTPREADQAIDPATFDPDAKAAVVESQPIPQPEVETRAPAERVVVPAPAPAPRQVGYGDAAIPEEEVQLYGYRPTRKPARRAQKKRTFI